MSGTGLKKCSPTKRSPRFVAAAIAAMVRLDVFEAKMAAGPHRPSSSFQRAFLSSRSSVTASTTMSHVFRSAVPGFDLPALEPVQHLLQPDLDVLVLRTVATKGRSGRRSEDQERQERERREQPHQPKGAARRGP